MLEACIIVTAIVGDGPRGASPPDRVEPKTTGDEAIEIRHKLPRRDEVLADRMRGG